MEKWTYGDGSDPHYRLMGVRVPVLSHWLAMATGCLAMVLYVNRRWRVRLVTDWAVNLRHPYYPAHLQILVSRLPPKNGKHSVKATETTAATRNGRVRS